MHLNVNIIVLAASMFVNLKLNKFNEILFFKKIIKHVVVKAKQTYIERLSFHWTSYLRVNESRYEGTPLDAAASHLTKPHCESMLVHLSTRGCHYCC